MKSGMDLNQQVRDLKGAPALIFIALVLRGGPQTVKHLCGHTAYSAKVVRQGLARLEGMGLAFCDPDFRAWYPVPRTPLLCRLHEALGATTDQRRPAAHAEAALALGLPPELSTELSTGLAQRGETTAAGEKSTAAEEKLAVGGNGTAKVTAVGTGHKGEDWTAMPEDSDTVSAISTAGAEEFTAAKEQNAASCGILPITTTTTTTKNLDPDDQVVVSKQAGSAKKQIPPSGAFKAQKILIDWLVRGGIGRRSPKIHELLASDLDLETVKAHVLERLAWEAGLVPGGPPYKPGLLIHKLLSGDPPPPMRCENCLCLPNKQGLCGCDYEILFKR